MLDTVVISGDDVCCSMMFVVVWCLALWLVCLCLALWSELLLTSAVSCPMWSSVYECQRVVVVCALQPSSSVNLGCPGPESSIPVSSRWACHISTQVTEQWGEPCNRTGEVHPVDPFHRLDNLKNHFASVTFCRNSGVYNFQNGAVIELSFVVSVKGSPRH